MMKSAHDFNFSFHVASVFFACDFDEFGGQFEAGLSLFAYVDGAISASAQFLFRNLINISRNRAGLQYHVFVWETRLDFCANNKFIYAIWLENSRSDCSMKATGTSCNEMFSVTVNWEIVIFFFFFNYL